MCSQHKKKQNQYSNVIVLTISSREFQYRTKQFSQSKGNMVLEKSTVYKATNSERMNREMSYPQIGHILFVQLRKAHFSADEYKLENIFPSNKFVFVE